MLAKPVEAVNLTYYHAEKGVSLAFANFLEQWAFSFKPPVAERLCDIDRSHYLDSTRKPRLQLHNQSPISKRTLQITLKL
jgi:hypothetical protein